MGREEEPGGGAEARLVYATAGGAEEARRIGRVLVAERLAACVNVVDPTTAIYRWEGEVREDRETVLIAKTRADRVAALTERLLALHGYDVPCVAAVPVLGGNAAFLGWIAEEAAPAPAG